MTAKEYLGQIELAAIKIRHLEERLSSLQSLGGAIQYDRVQVISTPENVQENRLVSLMDLEREVRKEKEALEELRVRITREIHKLTKPQYIRCLYMRYVNCDSVGKISRAMCYEYDSARNLIRQARAAFGDLYGLDPESEDPEEKMDKSSD